MRLMLLIIGMVFVGYIFFNAMRKRRLKKPAKIETFEDIILDSHELTQKQDPLLEDYSIMHGPHEPESLVSEESTQNQSQEPAQVNEFIAITILPKQGNVFPGNILLSALHQHHFHFGKHNLYHRHLSDDPTKETMYTVASIVKPGFFEPEKMMKEHFPGLVVFMSTRAEGDVSSIFEKMLTSARHLAASLSGELCDSNRIPLTPHLIQQYRETIKISKEQVSQKGQQMW